MANKKRGGGKKGRRRPNDPRARFAHSARARGMTQDELINKAVRERLTDLTGDQADALAEQGAILRWIPEGEREPHYATVDSGFGGSKAKAVAYLNWRAKFAEEPPIDPEGEPVLGSPEQDEEAIAVLADGDETTAEVLRARLDPSGWSAGVRKAQAEGYDGERDPQRDLLKRMLERGELSAGEVSRINDAVARLAGHEGDATPEDVELVAAFTKRAQEAMVDPTMPEASKDAIAPVLDWLRPDAGGVRVSDVEMEGDGLAMNVSMPPAEWAKVEQLAAEAGETPDEFLANATRIGAEAELAANAAAEAGVTVDPTHATIRGGGDDGGDVRVPIMNRDDDGPLWMPTPTLVRFSRMAQEAGLPRALSDEWLDRLEPDGRHIIGRADVRQSRRADGTLRHHARVRLSVRVRMPGGEAQQEPEHVEVDLPLKQFGMLIEGHVAQVGEHAAILERIGDQLAPFQTGNLGIEKPRWVGSRSFGPLWEDAAALSRMAMLWARHRSNEKLKASDEWDTVREAALHPRSLLGMDALERLQRCRVLSVDVDVFEGAPEWESPAEAWAFAARADLPADPLYLDLTTAGGLCPLIDLRPYLAEKGSERLTNDDVIELRGALIWRAEGGLMVVPIGWPRTVERAPVANFAPQGYSILGRVSFGGRTPTDDLEWARIKASAGALRDLSAVLPVVPPRALLGGAELAGRVEAVLPSGVEGEPQAERIAALWAQFALLAASRALSVLAMLEAINIEIGEPRPTNEERRMMKRAAKRGWPVEIAPTVNIRPSKYAPKYEGEGESEGPKRIYSHAFWRRGHYAYYPLGTRIADKLAEENPDDQRLVEHPSKGLCRKVFRQPVIIGRTDADGNERQPIAKTLVWRSARAPKKKAA